MPRSRPDREVEHVVLVTVGQHRVPHGALPGDRGYEIEEHGPAGIDLIFIGCITKSAPI